MDLRGARRFEQPPDVIRRDAGPGQDDHLLRRLVGLEPFEETLFAADHHRGNRFPALPGGRGTAGGEHVPVIRPGYPERYRKVVIETTGDRYLVPETR